MRSIPDGQKPVAAKERILFYSIFPRQNEIGEWGFVTYDVRKLHNLLYHEEGPRKDQDPWA